MAFEDLSLEEISTDDLKNLIGTTETSRLDFKREYASGDSENRKIARDVAAFANAEGGYLVIGIEEDNDHRASQFVSLDSPAAMAERIRDVCAANIEKKLLGIQFRIIEVDEKSILLVRVPDEEPKPHWVREPNEKVSFPRRVGDANQTMTMEEVREAILGDRSLRKLEQIDGLIRSIQQEPRILPQTLSFEALSNLTDELQLKQLLDTSFEKQIDGKACFRITCCPTLIPLGAPLYEQSARLLELLRNPPRRRQGGWDIKPSGKSATDEIGLHATNEPKAGGLRLLWNGYAEYWCETQTDLFQWTYAQIKQPRHFILDPRAIIEPIVCMADLAREIASLIGKLNSFNLRAEFWNCSGAKLIKYWPESAHHRIALSTVIDGSPEQIGIGVLEGPRICIPPVRLDIEVLDDSAAKSLTTSIYKAFGHHDARVPYFDNGNRFTLST